MALNEREIFELYSDEINQDSFSNNTDLLKLLIMYKHLVPVESYIYNGNKLELIIQKEDAEAHACENSIIIGGKPVMDDAYVDELTSAFINQQIAEDSKKYKIYINPEFRILQIYREGEYGFSVMNRSIERILCAVINKLMPWWFENIDAELRNEIALMVIDKENPEKFDEKFQSVMEAQGVTDRIVENKLKSLARNVIERKNAQTRDRLLSCESDLENCFRRIHELNEKIMGYKATIAGWEIQQQSMEDPIMEIFDFVKTTPEDIKIKDVRDNSIVFQCKTVLEYFEHEEDYKSIISENDGRSYIFGHPEYQSKTRKVLETYTKEEIKEFYKRVAETHEYKIWTNVEVTLDIVSGYLDSHKTDIPNTMPQPHLGARFSCFGTSSTMIQQYVNDNRFTEALNQLAFAVKEFSVSDVAVGKILVEGLVKNKCIELPDGKFVNLEGALKVIRGENEKEGEKVDE